VLTVYIEEVGTVSAGTITLTHADNYIVQRTDLKWWTYATDTVSVVT